MDNSLRIVPSANQASSSTASVKDTSNALGAHDTLRHGFRSLAVDVKETSPLQGRLENWEATQDNLKLNMMRSVYGLHAPVRLLMERKAVSQARNPHMPALPRSNIHLDILMGRDEALDASDFMTEETGPELDIHAAMEKKSGI